MSLACEVSRNQVLAAATAAALGVLLGDGGRASAALDDLPPMAQKTLYQYAPALQLSADFYLFELREMVANSGRWDQILEQFKESSSTRFASVSRVERDFYSPMRNIAQSLEGFGGEELLSSSQDLEASMRTMNRIAASAAGGGVSMGDEEQAMAAWEAGRKSINSFFAQVNSIVGTDQPEGGAGTGIRLAPLASDPEASTRGKDLYLAYKKELAKCQQGGLGVNVCSNLMGKYASGADLTSE